MQKLRLSEIKRNRLVKSLLMMVVIVFLPTVFSCERRPLIYEGEEDTRLVTVSFDWSDITDHELPTAMRVLFYPLDNELRTEPYIFDIAGSKGGQVQLPEGRYEVVSYNHDTDNILVSGASAATSLSATTQKLNDASRSVNIPDSLLPKSMALYDSPEWFCSAYLAETDAQAITLKPEWSVYKVSYEIHGIRGMRYVNHAEGYFTGMSSSLHVSANEASADSCAVLFQPSVSEKDSVLRGSLYYWGQPSASRQTINIFLWGQSGTYKASKDLTAEFAAMSGDHSHNHEINIKVTLDVEFKPGKGGGFNPSVDDYKEEYHDIPIK